VAVGWPPDLCRTCTHVEEVRRPQEVSETVELPPASVVCPVEVPVEGLKLGLAPRKAVLRGGWYRDGRSGTE